MKILFVCLGNICRSPLAEELLRSMALAAGLPWQVDSAGTGNWHVGRPPHQGSIEIALENNLDIRSQRARRISEHDFYYFDKILALDRMVYEQLMNMAPTPLTAEKVKLLLNLIPDSDTPDVHDPYYDHRFSHTFNQLHNAISYLVQKPNLIEQ